MPDLLEPPADRWDERYRARLADPPSDLEEPAPFLTAIASRLARAGRALDLAAGLGRNAIWLARRGLDVVAVDVSSVACDHLRARAGELGLPIVVLQRDVAAGPLPAGPFDLIVVVNFLDRALASTIEQRLVGGGLLAYTTLLAGDAGARPHRVPTRGRRASHALPSA